MQATTASATLPQASPYSQIIEKRDLIHPSLFYDGMVFAGLDASASSGIFPNEQPITWNAQA
jgi:hypothetical protein